MQARSLRRGVAVAALVCLGTAFVPRGAYAATSFANPASITINDAADLSGTTPAAATPYPSTINVSGLEGQVITNLTVTVTGITHTFPDDIDMLLVGPAGQNVMLMSDNGGNVDLNGITLAFDDAAASNLPNGATLTSGTFKPSNINAGSDSFPAPAPTPSSSTTLAAFNNSDPNGDWNLFVVDQYQQDSGSISGGWQLNIETGPSTLSTGDLLISEFRLFGPGGDNDEFVEVYNNTGANHTVNSLDGSAGYAVVASDGTARFTIPNGTVIPAGGHYLGVNSGGYTLDAYPAGNGTTATGDATYTADICSNCGIALFDTANPSSFSLARRFDAVGSTSEANALYKEGAGYPALSVLPLDHSFYRDLRNGAPKDTDTNAADFLFVDSNGTSVGAGQRLGVAGPENLSSPILGNLPGNPGLRALPIDLSVDVTAEPNQVRDFTSSPANNSTFGTLSIRRKITNNTGAPITRLRARVVDITTFPSPGGTSDLRPLTSVDTTATVAGVGTVTVLGTMLEQPPSQPNGGGFNSTFAVPSVTSATPLADGDSIYVQFVMGVQQDGTYRFQTDIPEYGALQFSAATYTVDESAGTATVTVSRVGGSTGAVTVDYATSDGTAMAGADYTAAAGTLSFAAGETSQTFTVPITDDTATEPDETLTLTLSNPGGGAILGVSTSATLTIGANDVPTEYITFLPLIVK